MHKIPASHRIVQAKIIDEDPLLSSRNDFIVETSRGAKAEQICVARKFNIEIRIPGCAVIDQKIIVSPVNDEIPYMEVSCRSISLHEPMVSARIRPDNRAAR